VIERSAMERQAASSDIAGSRATRRSRRPDL